MIATFFRSLFGLAVLATVASAQDAQFRVTDQVVSEPVEGITATIDAFGAGSRLMIGGGFEPISHRLWLQAGANAPAEAPGRILASPSEISQYDTLRDGALDGAQVDVLRLIDGQLEVVRTGRVPVGGHMVSGWIADLPRNRLIPSDATSATLRIAHWERPGQSRWYAIRAVGADGLLSDLSAPVRITLPDTLAKPRKDRSDLRRFDYDADGPADRNAPPAPGNVRARYDADTGTIELSWDKGARRGLTGFAIYKSYIAPERMQGFGIDTEGTGAPILAGDWITLRTDRLESPKSIYASDRVWNAKPGRLLRPGPIYSDTAEDTWQIVPHPDDPERTWGGRSYLQLDLPTQRPFRLGAANHSGTDQDFYTVLRPGIPYEVTVRLRGARPGRAELMFRGPHSDMVRPMIADYDTQWREVRFAFTLPQVADTGRAGYIDLILRGPGRVDVDDFRIRPSDTAWLDYTDTDYARLSQSGVSALRTHGWIKTGTATYDLEGLLSGGIVPGTNGAPDMFHTLSMMERAGVRPWLQIEPHLTVAEWQGLVEYLAAPFDPRTEDPATKPWAALRVRQGRTAPWIDAFDRIDLEIGNETWNGLFAPWTFFGMQDAQSGQKRNRAQVYGLYQSHVAAALRASPYWSDTVEARTRFVIGGRSRTDYGTVAARFAPDASDIVTVAAYNGGWDEGEGPPQDTPASYSNVLNQLFQSNLPRAVRQVADIRDLEARQNREIAVGTYEAGPGYALNGLNRRRVTEEQADEQEIVMKSRAAGVATLDTFLAQRRSGYRTQNFFKFGEGRMWQSHAPWHMGGAPYPSWMLLSLMNRLGAGEMRDVETIAVPRRDLPAFERREAVADAPQVAVYATGGADYLTLFAISRRVPNYPAGSGNNCTPVTIDLPGDLPAGPVTLYRTGGSHDDTGATGAPPPLERLEIPRAQIASGRLQVGDRTCGLPAASAYVYVIGQAPSFP
ncbi:hypothetical protein [Jannaschia sp. 2305UL9-9]|uniref:hypothetical protein n=1 Tax=Jannaschia sp. 2305UL9-9 TaxID=3121638 RepID=UPI0035294620